MRPTLSQLETLYWVARLGSFRAAGRHLNLTQPTVSLRVRELELTLGVELFHRIRQRAHLSDAGARMLGVAERMLALADEIHGAAKSVPLRGLLRVGAAESVALAGMPELVAGLKERYPELKVELSVDVSTQLCARLNERAIDLAFVTDPEVGSHVVSQRLGPIRLAWLASPKLDLPARVLRPRDLAECQIITNPRPSQLYMTIERWFAGIGLEPARVSTCNSLMLMVRYVTAGFGISVLPPAIVAEELRAHAVTVLSTRPPIPPRILHASFLRDRSGDGMREIIAMMAAILRRTQLVAWD
jgi:DNA-binding transcriptional LysR family regulator